MKNKSGTREFQQEGKRMDLILKVCTGRRRATMTCTGRLVEGDEAKIFRRSALLLMGGFDRLTIDVAGVRCADGGGLHTLASVLERAEEQGKQVRISHAAPWLLPMLLSAGFARFLSPFRGRIPETGTAQVGV